MKNIRPRKSMFSVVILIQSSFVKDQVKQIYCWILLIGLNEKQVLGARLVDNPVEERYLTIPGFTYDFEPPRDEVYAGYRGEEYTVDMCAEKCLSLRRCKAYTWQSSQVSSGLCFIFYNKSRAKACSNCITGIVAQIDNPYEATETNNYHCLGKSNNTVLKMDYARSEYECLKLCVNTLECRYYSFSGNGSISNYCFLFDNCDETVYNTQSCEPWQSGVRHVFNKKQRDYYISSHLSLKSVARSTRDCKNVFVYGTGSGVYPIYSDGQIIDVYCINPGYYDKGTGGWTVLQRRTGLNPPNYFTRSWVSYEQGFGDPEKDYWVGLRYWHNITSQTRGLGYETRDLGYEMVISMTDWENNTEQIVLKNVTVGNAETGYTINFDIDEGTFTEDILNSSGRKFSTLDNDNSDDGIDCAGRSGGGWWFGSSCHRSNLNGFQFRGEHDSELFGLNWESWKGPNYSLKQTEIKIRPSS